MARSRESFQKRAREKVREQRRAEKEEKRQAESADEGPSRAREDALMEEFAALSARLEADEISSERFDKERRRIFDELGLESEE